VVLRWTATGDDGTAGRAWRTAITRLRLGAPPETLRVSAAAPDAGAADSARFTALDEGVTYAFDVQLVDDAGRAGGASNPAEVTIPALAPGLVVGLAATAATESTVTLRWTATGGDGAAGRPREYRLAVSPQPVNAANFDAARHVVRAATVDAGGEETATVDALAPGRLWWFAILAEDSTGLRSPVSPGVSAITPVGGALRGRTGLALAVRGHPARLPAVLDWQGAPAAVGSAQRLRLFDTSGRLVRSFDLGGEPGGTLTWNGRDADGQRVPAGLYFARLESGSFRVTARLALAP
jgi:hypothetical protein